MGLVIVCKAFYRQSAPRGTCHQVQTGVSAWTARTVRRGYMSQELQVIEYAADYLGSLRPKRDESPAQTPNLDKSFWRGISLVRAVSASG